ncbi:MAG TPA: hypothetical protein VFL80_09580 [Thermoanaerobaculia bacterium]|nr:hypothetical protein [Thermoanaerobaculia bacterium]
MRARTYAAALLFATSLLQAAPTPKAVAPPSIPHGTALFLAGLTPGGKSKVTFRASAIGTHFFFEEAAGVTVYVYESGGYRKKEFLAGYTLPRALKKYDR